MRSIPGRPARRVRRTIRPLLALAVAVGLVAAACGSDSSDASGSGSTASSASSGSGSAPATKAASKTGKLVIGLSRQLTSLDPGNSGSLDSDASVQSAVFSGLTTIGPDQKLAGDLATSWTQKDATTWEFKLRPGVKFSDGTPFDANTVVYNFQRVIDPANNLSQGPPLKAIIDTVTAPDPTTVVITTKGTYLDLAQRLSAFYFVDQSFVSTHNPKTELLGTGPYEAVSVDLETGVTLKPNPNYYGKAPAYSDVEYRVLAAEASRVAAVQAGEVDVAIMLDPKDLSQFKTSDVYNVGSQSSTWNMVLRFNETKKPLDNLDVRLALNYAIDKAAIAKSLLGSDIQPEPGQVLGAPYDITNPSLSAYPYDVAKAKDLLTKAGYPDGFSVALDIPSGTYIAGDLIAQAIAAQLEKVNVKVTIGQQPFSAWVDKSRTPDVADLIYIGYSQGYPSTPERLAIYLSNYSQSHYTDQKYDDLVAASRKANTPEEQKSLIFQATQAFHDNPHVVFLFPQPLTWVAKKGLNWTVRPEHWLRAQDITPT